VSARVVVLDYGSGNLRSAQRALARAGADVSVSDDLDAAAGADGLVVPGVGAYAACMAGVERLGAGPVIADRLAAGRPVFGICVGMQILFEWGDEHGTLTPGLGLLPGGVTGLVADRVPHMGWNTVRAPAETVLFSRLDPGARFYFVHSYAATDTEALRRAGAGVTTACHGGEFVAAVEHGPLSATQFHPEKSGDDGAGVLARWVAGLAGGGGAREAAGGGGE
jgi:glutamine amidotransferase